MKKIILLFGLLFSMLLSAQENYEVVILPKKFEFQKSENQYNLVTLCKLFFEKEGFQVFYKEDLSEEEYFNNRCNYLYINLLDNGSMFTTKVSVEVKDCKNAILLSSKEAKTKEKDFNLAYNEVTREALIDLRGKLTIKNTFSSMPSENVAVVSAIKVEPIKEVEPINVENTTTKNTISENTATLSIIVTKNGYNLLDESKNIKFELLKTSNPTIFIAKKGNIQGVFTLNSPQSKFESYQNDELVVDEVAVKF